MTQPRTRRLTFEEFQAVLAEELMLPRDRLQPDADLVQDLQLDSLALASMMLRLEELGVELPLESAWEIRTVAEAYRVYRAGLGERPEAGPGQPTPLRSTLPRQGKPREGQPEGGSRGSPG